MYNPSPPEFSARSADRPAMTFGHALDQIKRESGTHFDPNVVHGLERIKDKISQALA